jgi:predicted extracellular nuclease
LIADRVIGVVRQLPIGAKVIVVGDFNDEATDPALRFLEDNGLHNVTAMATGSHGAKATYRYQGVWQSIDHVFVSPVLLNSVEQSFINDAPFLLEEDKKYGGVKPLRTYNGYRYQRGFSDHLPLVVRFRH